VLVTVGWCAGLAAQAATSSDPAAWRADLRILAEEVPRRHPAPFRNISRAQWDSAVNAIDRRLPTLSRNQSLVELYRLVAFLGDAHTTCSRALARASAPPAGLYSFEDGLFVRRADSAHAGLVGAKVPAIGRASATR
jgi:hypothetical protein